MTFETFISTFLMWSESKIEQKKLDGFPVCPFARKARMQDKIQFIDARSLQTRDLETFNKDKYEIGIAWLGDISDEQIQDIEVICEKLAKKNPELLYFTSTRKSGHFIKNFTDCVFIQLRGDIMEKRDYLYNTKYYDSWPKDYFKLITGLDAVPGPSA